MKQDEKELLLQKFAELNRKLTIANQQLEIANKKITEYEEKARKAENASRMKSLFLANMSHEIRTPLNAIEGFSRLIAVTESSEERMKFQEIIESNNGRLMSLVNEILDLSRVESGEIVIKKAETNLKSMMSSIQQLFKFRCPESIVLSWTAPDSTVIMNTDENRLTQVFSNLISNALKHTSVGSITFGYDFKNDGQEIEFFVKDTGSGIDPDFIDQIFNAYASQDAEQQKGFGLGLALCRIIVEKMGGHIHVKSKLGQGSTFIFEMPFHGKIGGMSTSHRTTTTVSTLGDVGKNKEGAAMKTILVAEDEESNYELVRIVLQKRYRLVRARNGIEAVTMNEDESPDLILMDIRMPEMNGLDATRIIKEVYPNRKVVALSAFAFDDNIKEAKAAGCDDFLAKPFRVEDLIETVKHYIDD